MMKKVFKILLFIITILSTFFVINKTFAAVGNAPSFQNNFGKYLTDGKPDSEGRVESVRDSLVDPDRSLKDNIRCLFYPNTYSIGCDSSSRGGKIWDVVRYIGYGLVVLMIVLVGVNLLIYGKDAEKTKTSLKSLLRIFIGSLVFFGSTWILGSVLGLENMAGTEGLVESLKGGPDSFLFKALAFLKALAFFVAIIMVVVYGFKMLSSVDQADKVKTGLKGVGNVIIALVIIKVIDYVYYIAQLPNIVEKTTELIIEIAKILGFILGAFLVIMIFYAGFLFITDQGKSDNMKKAKDIIVGVIVGAVVIFMLLLIIYQIFAEFA